MARDVSAPHLAALRMQLLERQSNTLPEALESLIWDCFIPLTVNGPNKCVREKLYQLPLKFEPIASSSLFDATGWLTGIWEHGKKIVRIGPGAKRAYGPFGRARGQVGEVASDIGSEVADVLLLGEDLYYTTSENVLHWSRLAANGKYEVMSSLDMPEPISELKVADGHLFVLLETADLRMVTFSPSMGSKLVCTLPVSGDSSISDGSEIADAAWVMARLDRVVDDLLKDRSDFLQDVLVTDGRVTHVLFAPGERRLCLWRPDGGIFEVGVPEFCCCRFVPRTNGTVVAGVFGNDRRSGFNICNIYEGKVPAMSLDAEKGRVISVVISHDWQVSVVTYNDTAPQGSRGAATTIKLSRTGAKTYDHGFNSHIKDEYYNDSIEGYDSDAEAELLGLGSGYSGGYDYYDDYDDGW
ncbi:hypothetical protein FOZ60_005116 [Perkinsus olseni]|uniref:Uncharacterized protein n=1 Tax=Perkinsus olseni TaxID=32597 RepID=A0A7J6PGM8_PEROL|nr:hypothetical protein FOZ60_005116 [Perkinsus olseni]